MNFPYRHVLPTDQTERMENLIHALLTARAATASAGNRRALYARMDELFASGTDLGPARPALNAMPQGGDAVRLTRMRLRNWKAFERADLVFPEPRSGRALVIVGGANGFGKSSILEAFVFALFGRRALSEIGFLIDGTGGRKSQRQSYRLQLERALHRSDHAGLDGMCSVALEFETAAGPIAVERKWYFDDDGSLIEEDEELVVRVGADRHLLEAPPEGDTREWHQAEIERRIMPATLAPFFIFDGEQVERWAERKLSDQVRMAISSLLGLEELNGLAQDLRTYTRDRERNASTTTPEASESLSQEIGEIEAELRREELALAAIEVVLEADREARNDALARLAAIGTASHADLQTQLETGHRLEIDSKRLRRELIGRIAEFGPLLLAGPALGKRLGGSLDVDTRIALASGIEPDEIEILWNRFVAADPPLDPAVAAALRERFVESCSPVADPAVGTKRHPHLDRTTRSGVRAMLRSAGNGHARLGDAAQALDSVDRQIGELRAAEQRQAAQADMRVAIQQELAALTAKVEDGVHQRGTKKRHIDALLAELEPKRAELSRHRSAIEEAEPRLQAAEAARTLASLIEAQMERTADKEYGNFAHAVTTSYYALAHKKQIARIAIGASGTISLFDAADRDVTDYRLSAGESQLFAMALIAAVGQLIGDRLPLIVDTPLGRLDTVHRQSVLAMFGQRRSQTILLTQPEEVNAAHLAMLEPVLAGSVHIAHEVDPLTGIGVSSIAVDGGPDRDAA